MEKKIKIALIAHDRKKEELVKFVKENEKLFARFQLIATRTTGTQLLKKTNLKVQCVEAGVRGGDQEIGIMISNKELHGVFFFRDLLTAKDNEPDANTIPRLCDIYNLPIATNTESAKGILGYFQNGILNGEFQSQPEVYSNKDVNIDRFKSSEEEVDMVFTQPKTKVANATLTQENDPMIKEVLTYIHENQKASALLLQLKFRMTSNRATQLIKRLETQGVIGPMDGNKPREVLMTEAHYQKLISQF